MTPQLAMGICIMLFGMLLALDRLGILAAAQSFRLWPAVLVVLGAWLVATQRRDGRGRFWGFVLMFVGTWWVLNNWGIVQVRFWALAWPLALVVLGITLVMQTLRRGNPSHRRDSSESSQSPGWMNTTSAASATDPRGTLALFAVLGESKRSCNDTPFRGGEMTAIMGGCHLDLRQATIPPGHEAVIDVFAVMGGHEIWVPGDWTVVSQVVPLMGSVDDKRLPAVERATTGEGRPRLVLRGFVVMGGLVIKN